MSSCLNIVVEEEQVVQTVDEVALIVSGIVGVIVGAIIGVIVFKCFLSKKLGIHSHHTVSVEASDKIHTEQQETSLVYENMTANAIAKKPKAKRDSYDEKTSHRKKFFVLDDFVSDMTWDKMVLELGKQELFEIMQLELSLWEERHTCLLQWYRCMLNDFLVRKYINDSQYQDILMIENRALSNAYSKMKSDYEAHINQMDDFQGQSLMDPFIPLQEGYTNIIKNMVIIYRESPKRFVKSISHYVDKASTEEIQYNLMIYIDEIEGNFRENQDEVIESIHALFQEFGTIVRELVVALICECELNRLLSMTCNNSLEKLVKTGRISSVTKEKVKDSLPDDFNVSALEVKEVFSQMHPNILAHYETSLQQHEDSSNTAIQNILYSYTNQTSSEGFVGNYLSTTCEQKLRRLMLLKELAKNENSGIANKFAKLSELQDEKRNDILLTFCKLLEESDALSESELHQMTNEFRKRLEASRDKVLGLCKRNITELWKRYDSHCMLEQEEENCVDASILQDAVTDDLLALERFLSVQISLSNEDGHAIIQERESLFLLLINQINLLRAKWFHIIENDLAKCQAFLLMKKSTSLVNENMKEVLEIIERLWNERNMMRNYIKETASVTCIKSILTISSEEMCKIISHKLVSNLIHEQLSKQDETFIFDSAKHNIIEGITKKNTLLNSATIAQDHVDEVARVIQEEINRHDMATSMVEGDVRATHLKRQGRLKIKAQRIAQHSPSSSSMAYDIQPLLEQILLQYQVLRAADSVENESSQQALIERMNLDKSTSKTLSDISKDSETFLLCKLGVISGLTKSEFTACINKAKKETGLAETGKSVAQKFQKLWRDAVTYINSISY
ncbi:uncharacterized protein LOC120340634 [Styela clava]